SAIGRLLRAEILLLRTLFLRRLQSHLELPQLLLLLTLSVTQCPELVSKVDLIKRPLRRMLEKLLNGPRRNGSRIGVVLEYLRTQSLVLLPIVQLAPKMRGKHPAQVMRRGHDGTYL